MYRIEVHIEGTGTVATNKTTIAECWAWYLDRIRPDIAAKITIEKV